MDDGLRHDPASRRRGEGPRGGGEAAGRARGERRDAGRTTAPRQPSSRRRTGHVEVVRLLAELGANVETPEQRRRTRQPFAAAEGPRGGGEAAGRARGERRDAEQQRRHASLHRGAERPRGGGEAAGRARGERRDAERTAAPRQPISRRRRATWRW